MPLSHAASPSALIQRRLLLICVLAGVVLLFMGVQRLVFQIRQVEGFRAIPAAVVDRGIRSVEDDRFVPYVAYRFSVGQEVLRTDQLFSRRIPLSRQAAEAALEPYAIGQTVTAYFNPAIPERTFLRLNLAFGPYVLCLMGVALLATGLALSRWQGRYGVRAEPPPRTRAIAALACAVIWQLGGALVWSHYLHHQPPPYPWTVWVVLPLYGLGGLVPLAIALRFARLHRAQRRTEPT
ncbi:DUF3592 domain-containing protein [Candidatus Macondimonas diazotrophica]|jgi:hypothetical protein|uniref:DUF3592 domain-containing protein n=1 Tax=Candidatus Macondimonas diazotrophica TaxID=2305248 RepID=A0A4Z0FB22_9GAMM|nr:DUF3592 domain-containing protein [Candidatus Macondimonas diazotrophica]NCU00196.1 DUF3592 domain-containing protein [Candidatus Macondimonas diazotrophica]TFZ82993.1 DUF3592 domain-containing protein [Candidatus Macondimonas diazotrophica]HBG30288.1 hypothetical protein [Gammaproteobacteria bacterium]